ncbi:hypothetical protein [Haliangium sp.]|uniref:hypothetical protein n=1 Tax=Haliangium sp. TaxID=2663208 RepID=UPI003D0CCCBE
MLTPALALYCPALRRALCPAGLAPVVAVVAALALPAHAWAQAGADAQARSIQEPIRLTAGGANQWMGALSPSGDALYFVSDQNAIAEIFVQDPVDSGPRLLFENNADVSWPRPSPDGARVAYISYHADATGDLCVFDLASKEQRCLTGPGTAELEPVWLDGGRRLGALVRTEIHGDYQVRSYDPAGGVSPGDQRLARNMLGMTVSPDSRWIAYVSLQKTSKEVGVSFGNQSAGGLVFERLGNDGAGKPVPFMPDLPGITEFPAFSTDGRFLYFAQYLNDTNADGSIDGNDNSVLFRVPFRSDAADPVGKAWPEQLTSAQWNCRYPSLTAERLIVTCAHQGSLDIYALPTAGAVPESWDAERLRGEIHAARNHWAKLLLYGHLTWHLREQADPRERIAALRHMIHLHVELREYESAGFYADQLARLAGQADATATAWAGLMRELVGHRRAEVQLTLGQLSDAYLAAEKERAKRVEASRTSATGADPNIDVLARLILSEIHSDVGLKAEAKLGFETIELGRVTEPLVLDLYATRAQALYSLRADRQALIDVYRALAGHGRLDTLDRLRFAEQFVAELVRGVPRAERGPKVQAWVDTLSKDEPQSELTLVIQVAGLLQQLDRDNQEDVRASIFELYKANKDPDRRRALVLATVRTAAREGNEYLQYQFATSWASWLQRSMPERKYAETLYRQVVLERAYTELAAGEYAKARATFYAATVQSTSLEAHIGFIEARLREGQNDVEETYAKRYEKQPDNPENAFVQAYLIARGLRRVERTETFLQACERAVTYLRKAAQTWPRSLEIQHVWGTVMHQRALRTGSKTDAIDAYRHYSLALDLARDNVRFRASLHLQIGLLQAALGNHRIALDHFAQRDRLPFVNAEAELGLRVARARSYFHIGKNEAAATEAERALALVGSSIDLVRYKPLVEDRLALYQQSAGAHTDALARYDALVPEIDRAQGEVASPVNRIKARLGAAAAALGAHQYQVALERIGEVEELLAKGGELRSGAPKPSFNRADTLLFDRRDYDILVAGLRAQAHRGLEDYPAATKAMQRRYDLLTARLDDAGVDEDVIEMARASYHLAEYAFRQGDKAAARVGFERGLAHAADYHERTGSEVTDVGLRLLQAYAELHIYGGVPLSEYQRDLLGELGAAYEFICKFRSPEWEADRFLFEVYLTMLEVAKK